MIARTVVASLLVALVSPVLTEAQPRAAKLGVRIDELSAAGIIERALIASGGEKTLRSIDLIQAPLAVTLFRTGHAQWPGAPVSPVQLEGTETQDFANDRASFLGRRTSTDGTGPFRVVITRDTGFELFFGYPVAYTKDSLTVRARDRLVRPERILLTARDSDCRMDSPASVRLANRAAHALRCVHNVLGEFRLRVDSASSLPLEVEIQRPSRVFGQENVVIAFGAFRDVATPNGMLTFPAIAETRVGGRVTSVATWQKPTINVSAEDSLFAIPDRARPFLAPVTVEVQVIAPGVEYLRSGVLYFALAVETDSGVVLIETGETEHRAQAFIDTVRARFRDRPIRGVVATHHHADHIASLPAVFDNGLAVFTSAANASTVQAVAAAAKARRPHSGGRVIAVRDSLVFGAGSPNELRLYAASAPEATTHLVAYLPRHSLLVVSDMLEGPFALESVTALRKMGLRVDHVATAHRGLRPPNVP